MPSCPSRRRLGCRPAPRPQLSHSRPLPLSHNPVPPRVLQSRAGSIWRLMFDKYTAAKRAGKNKYMDEINVAPYGFEFWIYNQDGSVRHYLSGTELHWGQVRSA